MKFFIGAVLAVLVSVSTAQYYYESVAAPVAAPVTAPVAAPIYETPVAVAEAPVYTYNSYLPVGYNSPVAAAAYPYAYALYGSNKAASGVAAAAPAVAAAKAPSPSQ